MLTKMVDVAGTNLQELLKMLQQEDTEILITEDEKPLARLVLVAQPAAVLPPRVAGLGQGDIWVSDDFDDPLPDEFWLGEE